MHFSKHLILLQKLSVLLEREQKEEKNKTKKLRAECRNRFTSTPKSQQSSLVGVLTVRRPCRTQVIHLPQKLALISQPLPLPPVPLHLYHMVSTVVPPYTGAILGHTQLLGMLSLFHGFLNYGDLSLFSFPLSSVLRCFLMTHLEEWLRLSRLGFVGILESYLSSVLSHSPSFLFWRFLLVVCYTFSFYFLCLLRSLGFPSPSR